MAGKQRFVSSSPPVLNQCYRCDLHHSLDNTGSTFTSSSRFYLPVSLPFSPSLPPDVALWLVELRHKSDSSDLFTDVRPSVGDDTVWFSNDEDQENHHFELNFDSESDPQFAVIDCEEICTTFHNSDDTVLNLDLHRKRTAQCTDDNENEDLYQIWEGLKIPRQSLCASSLRVQNLNANCEVLSRDSETDSRSYIETNRDHSYWVVNPMYSKGGLVDSKEARDVDKSTGGRNLDKRAPLVSGQDRTREWGDQKRVAAREIERDKGKYNSNTTSTKESGGALSTTPKQVYVGNANDVKARSDGSPEDKGRSTKPDHNKNWRLTDITECEECVDDVGVILSYENNYGLGNCSADNKKDLSSVITTSMVAKEASISTDRPSSPSGSTTQSESGSEGHKGKQSSHLNSPLGRQCVNILNNLDDMILTFQQIQDKALSKGRNDSLTISIKDNDFDHMCERAELIIEETLKCHFKENSVKSLKKTHPASLVNAGKSERNSSEMSDEVFLNPTSEKESTFNLVFSNEGETLQSERHNNMNVNDIFDDGSKTTAPVPPLRKKRIQDLPNVSGIEENSTPRTVERKELGTGKDIRTLERSYLGDSIKTSLTDEKKSETEKNKTQTKNYEKPLVGEKPTIDKNPRYEIETSNKINSNKESGPKRTDIFFKSDLHTSTSLQDVSQDNSKYLLTNFHSLERQREGLNKINAEGDNDSSRTKPVPTRRLENVHTNVKTVAYDNITTKPSNSNSLERQREGLGKISVEGVNGSNSGKPISALMEDTHSSVKTVVRDDTKVIPPNLERQCEGLGKINVEGDSGSNRTKPVPATRLETLHSSLKTIAHDNTMTRPLNINSLERQCEGIGKLNVEGDNGSNRTKPVPATRLENKQSSLKTVAHDNALTRPPYFNSLERQREGLGKLNVEDDNGSSRSKPLPTRLENIHTSSKTVTQDDSRSHPSNYDSLERKYHATDDKKVKQELEPLRTQFAQKNIPNKDIEQDSPSRSGFPYSQPTNVPDDKVGKKYRNASNSADNPLPDECFSSLDSNSSFDYKIQLTQTRPISFSTFPPSTPAQSLTVTQTTTTLPKNNLSSFKSQNAIQQRSHTDIIPDLSRKSNTAIFTGRPLSFHNFPKTPSANSDSVLSSDSSACLLKYANMGEDNLLFQNTSNASSLCDTPRSMRSQGSDNSRPRSLRKSFDNTSLDESLERTRKGSNASDIAAWKQRLQLANSYYHDEEMDPNSMMSNEWFSSNNADSSGYLHEENMRDCSSTLPEIQVIPCQPQTDKDILDRSSDTTLTDADPRTEKLSFANIASLIEAELRGKQHGPYRVKKSKSMILNFSKTSFEEKVDIGVKPSVKWPDVWDENMKVKIEGILHRTKITDNGKKVRKNWVTSFAVLTEQYLLFFKDVKTFNAMKISTDKFQPEFSIDLSCGFVEQDEKLSSRKNVLSVGDGHGLQVLLQLSTPMLVEQWYHLINTAIALQLSTDACLRLPARDCSPPSPLDATLNEEVMKSPRIARARSIKVTNKELESNEDLSASAEERQTKNRARLKKFFGRRPTKDSLVKKGIYKDEPMFGRNLCDVVSDCVPCVPRFVLLCIRAIESKEENMKTDGLYRASGNLSQVQKIRLQVDQNQLCALEQEEDVHVLTGALKLFFRELKKPLIPFELFNKAIIASAERDHKERVRKFRHLVQSLPTPNHNTLDFLLQHLLKVNQNKEFNRMHIPNIAIVFGPTLMWPEEESLNMALDLMKQNQVIECLLMEYDAIFC